VKAATTPPAKQFEPGSIPGLLGYGYQTWILPGKERQFLLRGLRGQAIYVDPKHRLVMVRTAAGNSTDNSLGETLSLWDAAVAYARRR
jgi:CubicO group peptidase (beta-lactamase class C family)